MGFVDALSTCWWLSSECKPRWEAWAAIGGIAAAFGSFAAALATYFAVIHPHRRRLREADALVTADLVSFIPELVSLREVFGRNGFLLSFYGRERAADPGFIPTAITRLQYGVNVPSIKATPEHLLLVNEINALRGTLGQWNAAARDFSFEIDGEYGGEEFADYVISGINNLHHELGNRIRGAAREIQKVMPGYAQTLQRALVDHDGLQLD